METVDMEDYRHNYVNLTAFRLVDRTDPRVNDLLVQMQEYQQLNDQKLLNSSTILKVSEICRTVLENSKVFS